MFNGPFARNVLPAADTCSDLSGDDGCRTHAGRHGTWKKVANNRLF
jgi:hypothetical protein